MGQMAYSNDFISEALASGPLTKSGWFEAVRIFARCREDNSAVSKRSGSTGSRNGLETDRRQSLVTALYPRYALGSECFGEFSLEDERFATVHRIQMLNDFGQKTNAVALH